MLLIDASIAQVEVLNEDFSATNEDISGSDLCPVNLPDGVLSLGACIEFCLAFVNHPDGSNIPEGDWAITVGQESWNPNDPGAPEWAGYFNIFVENGMWYPGASPLSGGAEPDGNGVHIRADAFGGPGVSCSGISTSTFFGLGRTATHEAGHYFGLDHIFAGCFNGDGIDDTPDQSYANTGCPSCPEEAANSCETEDFFFNYMDYVDDACMFMFTVDQADVMFNTAGQGDWADSKTKCNECLLFLPPVLSAATATNQCPNIPLDLNTLHTGEIPQNAQIIWSTDNDASDGVDPQIDPVVTSNGTYFAYYSNLAGDCFGPVSEAVVVTIESCCDIDQDDVHITGNETFDLPRVAGGNIIIHSGGQLTVTTRLEFREDESLIIKDGGKLNIYRAATLTTCPNAEYWRGVVVETGGEMSARNSYIYNAIRGIDAKDGSELSLDNNDILGNNDNGWSGVNLAGDVNLTTFEDMIIKDYFIGIYSSNNSGLYFNKGEINNTTYGVYLYNSSSVSIKGYTIDASAIGIYMDASHSIILDGNHIGFEESAISAKNSELLYIANNTIGYYTQVGKTGINLLNCQYANVYSNDNINATAFGIKAYQSDVLIEENVINVQGQNNTAGGGIQVTNVVNSSIRNNFVTANNSSFGIESVGGNGNEISHNDVSVFSTVSTRTAAIRTMGGMSETIKKNIINGEANVTGIIAQNSTDNAYDCNDITNTTDGIAIYLNSPAQDIKGNQFFDSDIDLTIRSVIGIQYHKGNEFVNGSARAIGLDEEDIDNSQFFVNGDSMYHIPSDPVPGNGEWFVPQNHVPNFYKCSDPPAGPEGFYEDEDKLCSYFNRVKLLQNAQPKVFFTRLNHLLKYEQARTGYTLPNCIKQDVVLINLYGLSELLDITNRLEEVIKSDNGMGDDFQAIRLLQAEYVAATDESAKDLILDNLRQSLALLMPDIENKLILDSLTMDEIKDDLEIIDDTDIYIQKWKGIYTQYIKYIQTGEVAQEDQNSLIEYSMECSDQYGGAIHLARSLANTFDSTYFDVYDGCLENKSFKSEVTDNNSLSAFVQPNPTKGAVILRTDTAVTGIITIFDLTGRVVFMDVMTDEYQHTLNLNLNGGLYFIYLTTDTGEVFIEKIMIAK